MYQFILVIHVITCALLIISVLLQTGKGSALSMFGGGGGDTLFAANTGTSFMKKFTTAMAITFAVTSLLLTMFASRAGMRSVTLQYPLQQRPQSEAPKAAAPEAARPAAPAEKPAEVPAKK